MYKIMILYLVKYEKIIHQINNVNQKISDLPDSNQRPKDSCCTLQSSALPTELRSDTLMKGRKKI